MSTSPRRALVTDGTIVIPNNMRITVTLGLGDATKMSDIAMDRLESMLQGWFREQVLTGEIQWENPEGSL